MASAQEYGYTHSGFSGTLYRVAIPSGSMETVGQLGGEYRSFAISSEGLLYGLSAFGDEVFLVDTITGAATNLGTLTVGPDEYPTGITFDQEGRLLMLASANPQSALYEVDPANLSASLVTWIDSNAISSIAISGADCYAASPYGGLFAVDISTGSVSELPGSSGGYYQRVHDLSFDGRGQLWATEEQSDPISGCAANYLARFNLTTGEYSRIVQLPVPEYECLFPLAIQPIPVIPVPAQGSVGIALVILAIASVGFVILLRRS